MKPFELSELGKLCLELVPQRFEGNGCQINYHQNPILTFPAAHADVGTIEVFDDGNELTVNIGEITHVHFDCFEDEWSVGQKRLAIVDDVSHFIREVLTEELELCKTWYGGGVAQRGKGRGQVFVWSGPIRDDRAGRRWRLPFSFW